MARTSKAAERQVENRIAEVYRRTCSGVQVNIMDVSKIYAAGRAALAAGQDLDTAIPAFVQTIRQN
jgi:hypothetical protein